MGLLLFTDFVGRYSRHRDGIGITGYIQSDGYSCGYAAAVTLLNHFKLMSSRRSLWDDLSPDPDTGVTTSKLLKATRKRGLVMTRIAVTKKNMEAAFSRGYPVLVCAKLDHQPDNEEHWMIAAGVKGTDVLLLNQPSWRSPRAWWALRKLRRRASYPFGWVARPKGE
jgi:hypothetical protein